MKTIQIIFLFLSYCAFSQKAENIKTKDTIYVFYDGKKNQERTEYLIKFNDSVDKSLIYSYLDKNHKKILFFHATYLNFDDMDNNKKAIKTEKKCRFFRKNKQNVINADFFIKNGIEESYVFLQRKFIFLIDVNEKKGKKYLLKEVRVSTNFELE